MREHDFDVIVVGGGPAGSSAAYAAAKSGSSVAIIEKEKRIAESVRTSGVTWIEDAESFGIPSEYYNPIRNYAFASPKKTVITKGDRARAAVLDVRKTYRWLAEMAESEGARIFLNSAVTGVLKEGRRVRGVVSGADDSREEFRSDVVIDASGFQSVVSRAMGLVPQWKRFGAGAEYEVRAENVDPETWWLMVGNEYSPAGYAWIFPLGGGMARIGVGVGKPESAADPVKILDGLMKKRPGPIGRLGTVTPIEFHYGLIPNEGLVRKTAYDGLLLVGDSAGQANPLVLEGIRYAIKFGRMAGEVASGAAANGDASERELLRYDRLWRSQIQSKIDSALKVQRRWIGLTDDEWDDELETIRELNIEELVDFIKSDFGLSGMARLAVRHPRLAARQLFRTIKDVAGTRRV